MQSLQIMEYNISVTGTSHYWDNPESNLFLTISVQ